MVGNNNTNATAPNAYLVDLRSPAIAYPLWTSVLVSGLAADDENGILYITTTTIGGETRLHRWFYSDLDTGPMPLLTEPELIGPIRLKSSPLTNLTELHGLAWDEANKILYTVRSNANTGSPEGIYRIELQTGQPLAVPAFEFAAFADREMAGLDYDLATQMLYGVEDDSTPGPIGLWRINPATWAFTHVAAYPAFNLMNSEVDGLAILDGRAYFIVDRAAPAEVGNLNLTTLLSTTPFASPLTVTPSSVPMAGGAGAPSLLPVTAGQGPDLQLRLFDSPDPLLAPGAPYSYTLQVVNRGVDPATGVEVAFTLPPEATFLMSDPPVVPVMGVLTFNFASIPGGTFQTVTIDVQSNVPGVYSATASVTSIEADASPGNNFTRENTAVRAPTADLSVAVQAPVPCTVLADEIATFDVLISNAGPDTADGVSIVVTIPMGMTLFQSFPAGTLLGDQLTIPIPPIDADSTGFALIDLIPASDGFYTVSVSVSSTTLDPVAMNDVADASLQVPDFDSPATATAMAVFSSVPTHPSSLLPGEPIIRFLGTEVENFPVIATSSNGRYFSFVQNNNSGTATDSTLLRGTAAWPVDQPDLLEIVLREGDALPDSSPALIVGNFLGRTSINNSGRLVFSTTYTSSPSLPANGNEGMAQIDLFGNGLEVVREGQLAAAGLSNFNGLPSSAQIRDDGSISFYSAMVASAPVTSANSNAFFSIDAPAGPRTVLARYGITSLSVPAALGGPVTTVLNSLFNVNNNQFGLLRDYHGNTLFANDLNTPTPPVTSNGFLIRNLTAVVREGFVIPGSGFTSAVGESGNTLSNFIHGYALSPNGDWYAFGRNLDGQDWVLRNGEVVARTGDPIFTGSMENWSDAVFARTFNAVSGNRDGGYIIAGFTDNPNPLLQQVVVYFPAVGTPTVLLRGNDPVDLDANGLFDDDIFVGQLRLRQATLTPDALYAMIELRTAANTLCGAADPVPGRALVKVPLPLASRAGDRNADLAVDAFDLAEMLSRLGQTGSPANLDGDSASLISVRDISIVADNYGRPTP